jgi:hypothetical protein
VLAAGAVAIAIADLSLVAICWRRRTVLGGVAAAVGIPLVAFAIISGLSGRAATAAMLVALIFLIVGSALHGLGRAFERLLDEEPGDGT